MRKIAGHKESWQTNTCQQVMTAINWQLRKKCGIKNERRTLESHGLGFLFNKIQNIIHLYSNSKIMIEKEIFYYKSTEQHKYKWQWHWQWEGETGGNSSRTRSSQGDPVLCNIVLQIFSSTIVGPSGPHLYPPQTPVFSLRRFFRY